MSEETGDGAEQADKSPLRRTLDVCVFAPVGVALTVVEDLPGLISKGRQRVELELSNARVVGRFVVSRGQREVSERLGDLWSDDVADTRTPDDECGDVAAGNHSDEAPDPATMPAASDRPTPDPLAAAVVGGALADYDTLSASQVVRRLPSLGRDELRAVYRHEVSHRNRRTILNRASQLLDEAPAAPPAD